MFERQRTGCNRLLHPSQLPSKGIGFLTLCSCLLSILTNLYFLSPKVYKCYQNTDLWSDSYIKQKNEKLIWIINTPCYISAGYHYNLTVLGEFCSISDVSVGNRKHKVCCFLSLPSSSLCFHVSKATLVLCVLCHSILSMCLPTSCQGCLNGHEFIGRYWDSHIYFCKVPQATHLLRSLLFLTVLAVKNFK